MTDYTNAKSAMGAPRKADAPAEPEVKSAFEKLERALKFAEDRTSLLEERLNMALRPTNPAVDLPSTMPGMASPMAIKIYESAAALESIATRLDTLIDRLDF